MNPIEGPQDLDGDGKISNTERLIWLLILAISSCGVYRIML